MVQQKYVKTGDLTTARCHQTMISTNGGNVLAVSGLDDHGRIIDGNNEMYEISKNQWFDQPDLNRYFPTYPQLFRLKDDRLLFSGANTGYGSATKGRQPGIWDLTDNSEAFLGAGSGVVTYRGRMIENLHGAGGGSGRQGIPPRGVITT